MKQRSQWSCGMPFSAADGPPANNPQFHEFNCGRRSNQLRKHNHLSSFVKKRKVGWVFGLPRSRELLGAPLAGCCCGRIPFHSINWIPFHSFLQPLRYLFFLLLHCLLSLIGWLVFFFGRSHWLASQPITHPQRKATNQINQPFRSSARTAIHFINHSWIGLFSWAAHRAAINQTIILPIRKRRMNVWFDLLLGRGHKSFSSCRNSSTPFKLIK